MPRPSSTPSGDTDACQALLSGSQCPPGDFGPAAPGPFCLVRWLYRLDAFLRATAARRAVRRRGDAGAPHHSPWPAARPAAGVVRLLWYGPAMSALGRDDGPP